MKPRILFICQTNNALKGTEKVFTTLAAGLSNGYEVHFLAIEKEEPAIELDAVTFHFLNFPFAIKNRFLHKVAHFLYLIRSLPEAISNLNPDIVISSLDEINLAIGVTAYKNPDVTYIATIHTNPDTCLTGFKKILAKYTFPKFEKVVCVSEGLQGAIVNISQKIHTEVIYNPVHIEQEPAKRVDTIKKIIFVGNLTLNKGIHHLVRVLSQIPSEERPSLEVYGDGEMRSRLESFCRDTNIEMDVTFHGVTRDVYSALKEADVLVLPTYSEAFGLVLAEALKNGIPVITSDANYGPREILNINKRDIVEPYTSTASGLLLPAPDTKSDTVDLHQTELSPFEKILLEALTQKHRFLIDETLCNRFDTEVVLNQWQNLLTDNINHV